MASSVFPTITTGVTVSTATAGALTGDGSSGNKLSVAVDTTTVTVNGSNQLAAGGTDATVTTGGLVGKTMTFTAGVLTDFS